MKAFKKPFLSTPLFAVVGRAGGFFIPLVIAYFYGAGAETDAFFLAFGLIVFLTNTLTHVFESVIIPYLVEQRKKFGQVYSFSNGVLYLTLPGLALLCLVIALFLKEFLVRWTGWDPAHGQLATQLFVEMLPFLFLGIWACQGNGIFYTNKIFWFPALSPLLRSLPVIFFIGAGHVLWGIHAISFGFVVGEALRSGVSFFLLWRSSFWKFQADWRQKAREMGNFFRQISFQLLALLAVNVLYSTDLWFASRLGEGNLSLLNYADRLLQIGYLLFQTGFLQVFHSFWSESYYYESADFFWKRLTKDIRMALGVTLAIALFLWLSRYFLVRIVFGQGNFTEDQLLSVVKLFGWYVISFVPGVLYLLYVRVLFVMKHSRFYCLLAWSHLTAKILLNQFLTQRFGVQGIVISTAVLYTAASLWLHLYIKNHRLRQTAA